MVPANNRFMINYLHETSTVSWSEGQPVQEWESDTKNRFVVGKLGISGK